MSEYVNQGYAIEINQMRIHLENVLNSSSFSEEAKKDFTNAVITETMQISKTVHDQLPKMLKLASSYFRGYTLPKTNAS